MKIDGESMLGDALCLGSIAVFAIGLLVLCVRLKELQIDSVAELRYAGERQTERRVRTAGARGRILDRRGTALAENRQSLSIAVDPAFFRRRTWEKTAAAILAAVAEVGEVIGCEPALTEEAVRRHLKIELSRPLTVWRDISPDVRDVFCEHLRTLPGFLLIESHERIYPRGQLAAHLLGYVGRDRGESVAGDVKYSFSERELCGRAGLEAYYDSYLRGVAGEMRLMVDARGFTMKETTIEPPRRGPDLELTLDAAIQSAAERQLEDVTGACVVIDPRDGAVLAAASSPAYDPNDLVPQLTAEMRDRYVINRDYRNRFCGETYAPGSTFKPVTALAALAAGVPAARVHDCEGVFRLGAMKLRCARTWGHGPENLRTALRDSCNPYFCSLAMEIGSNAVIRAALAMGLGEKTGLDFPLEARGVVPDDAWKRAHYGEKWYPGDLPQLAIGQGMLTATPLQMAVVAAALGTGYLVRPHLKRDIPPARRELPFSETALEAVRVGMEMVVNDACGSGVKGGVDVPVRVAGKTGTAEVGIGERRRKNTWFIAYAPADAPEVAIAMVVENGQSGGGTTAPRVAEILKEVFR